MPLLLINGILQRTKQECIVAIAASSSGMASADVTRPRRSACAAFRRALTPYAQGAWGRAARARNHGCATSAGPVVPAAHPELQQTACGDGDSDSDSVIARCRRYPSARTSLLRDAAAPRSMHGAASATAREPSKGTSAAAALGIPQLTRPSEQW